MEKVYCKYTKAETNVNVHIIYTIGCVFNAFKIIIWIIIITIIQTISENILNRIQRRIYEVWQLSNKTDYKKHVCFKIKHDFTNDHFNHFIKRNVKGNFRRLWVSHKTWSHTVAWYYVAPLPWHTPWKPTRTTRHNWVPNDCTSHKHIYLKR